MNNLIFVGGFNLRNNPLVYGGQLTACKALLESPLSEEYNLLLIDTTAEVTRERSTSHRLLKAAMRLCRLTGLLLFRRSKGVLIFTSSGFSFYEKGLMALLCKVFYKRVILFPRSGLILDDYQRSTFFRTFSKIVVKAIDYVICQGDFWQAFYSNIDKGKTHKFVVLNNWINIDRFPVHRFDAAKGYVINGMYLGHFFPYKGIVKLVEAAIEIEREGIPFVLNLYGDGPLKNQIQDLIVGSGSTSIRYHGSINDSQKSEIFKKNDIFILPSDTEGFPNALLEAMASGLATVATSVGGVPALVCHGVNGLLVSPGNKAELKSSVIRLLSDISLCEKLGRSARKTVVEKNSSVYAASVISGLLNKDDRTKM